ncbi:MAG: hemolysin family protein [Firmicutes bacterium]|nr:hemolysin family protein [Bacillota bacterium]
MSDPLSSPLVPAWQIILAVLLVIYRGLMACLLEAFHALPSLQRRRLLEEESIPHPVLARLLEQPYAMGLGLAFWNLILLVLLIALLWSLHVHISGGLWVMGLLFVIYLWIMDLALPTLLTGSAPAAWMIRLFPLYAPAHVLLAPLVAPLGRLVRRQQEALERAREAEDEDPSDDAVTALLEEGEAEGILEEEDRELIRNVVSFGDTVVREVMTPRISIQSVDVKASADAVWSAFRTSRHSRMPLVDGGPDQVLGILLLKDLVQIPSHEPLDLRALARPALFVPESKSTLELMREFQVSRNQIAIVVDEFGSVSGLATLEDLLEEVFGEIREEHESTPDIEASGEGCWNVPGQTHIEDLAHSLDVEWEREGYDTVAGLVMARLGHVPVPGEEVEDQGLRFTVMRMEGLRVVDVKVERLQGEHE